MVPNITAILQRLTGEWATLLQPEAILTICREIGYTAWRDRVLTPVTTVQLFLLQILHGNTACSHLPHLSGLRFSAAAYCQARAKLPLRFFDLLLERFGSAVQRFALDDGRWYGHRTFLVDGSGCSMPDTPALQGAFGQSTEQRPGCGFPVAHLLGLFHAGTGVLLKLAVAPLLTHDLAQVQQVHPMLAPGAGLVADRGPHDHDLEQLLRGCAPVGQSALARHLLARAPPLTLPPIDDDLDLCLPFESVPQRILKVGVGPPEHNVHPPISFPRGQGGAYNGEEDARGDLHQAGANVGAGSFWGTAAVEGRRPGWEPAGSACPEPGTNSRATMARRRCRLVAIDDLGDTICSASTIAPATRPRLVLLLRLRSRM
jgi:hypothetical protein